MLYEWMKKNYLDPNGFYGSLLLTYAQADLSNQEKLAREFPETKKQYDNFMNGDKYAFNCKDSH